MYVSIYVSIYVLLQFLHITKVFIDYRGFVTFTWNNKFMLSNDSPLLCDFVIAELLEQTSMVFAAEFEKFPTLKQYVADFNALPAIAKYREHPYYIKSPINNMVALF